MYQRIAKLYKHLYIKNISKSHLYSLELVQLLRLILTIACTELLRTDIEVQDISVNKNKFSRNCIIDLVQGNNNT